MEREILMSYGGDTATLIHPAALALMLVAGVLTLILKREYVIVPIVAALLLMSMGQRIVIAGLDFMIYRILILFVWLRLIIRFEFRSLKLSEIDRALIWWGIASVVAYTLLWRNSGAFVNRLGFAFDVFGIYFFVRIIARNLEDVIRIIKTLVVFSIPVAVFMVVESSTGRNGFAVFGGVPEFTEVRDDRLRCQGAFSHPIMAGSFGATLLPLAVSLWWAGNHRFLAVSGCIAATLITWTSASSGPVLTWLAAIFGLILWCCRNQMRWILWGSVVTLVFLHLVMKAPVWALVQRVNVFGGSTGWHRYHLIDNFVRRFDEWFLVGTTFTSRWGMNLRDQTNYYVALGVSGGIVTLILFVLVVKRCFAGLRRARLAVDDPAMQRALWAVGCSLFAHLVAFFGVSYFGQMRAIWYLLLAIISAVSSLAIREVQAAETESEARWPLAFRGAAGL